MKTHVTGDRAGRIVIPKPMRDVLHLRPGDKVRIDASPDGITVRPVRASAPLVKERGIWVSQASELPAGLSLVDAIDRAREERDREVLG